MCRPLLLRCAGAMITIDALTKTYGDQTVLDGVTFDVPAGAIVGFLGPNGAGKTTTMRILLGFAEATSGSATIDGRSYRGLPNPGRHVGASLDADCLHPGRTGRETLLLAARTMGLPTTRIAEVAAETGLSPAELKRRVRTYSLGMRQRLALALAILGDPAVLVLDEPTNGLDPQGQRWLAELLRRRADAGCAVLLSSHQLSAVGRLADRLVMIGGGRIVADDDLTVGRGSVADLEDRYFDLTSSVDRSA